MGKNKSLVPTVCACLKISPNRHLLQKRLTTTFDDMYVTEDYCLVYASNRSEFSEGVCYALSLAVRDVSLTALMCEQVKKHSIEAIVISSGSI